MEETGIVTPGVEPETGDLQKQGYYEYETDGVIYRVQYVADRNGVQVTGDHLPRDPAHEQLRRDHPELYWAETGAVVPSSQQPQPVPQFVRQNDRFSF